MYSCLIDQFLAKEIKLNCFSQDVSWTFDGSILLIKNISAGALDSLIVKALGPTTVPIAAIC